MSPFSEGEKARMDAVSENARQEFAELLESLMQDRGVSPIDELARRAEEAGFETPAWEFAEHLTEFIEDDTMPYGLGAGLRLALKFTDEEEEQVFWVGYEFMFGRPRPESEEERRRDVERLRANARKARV